jgi:hypothetical protein
MRVLVAALLTVAAVGLGGGFCFGSDGVAAQADRTAASDGAVFAYLADNTLVRTDERFQLWQVARIAPRNNRVRGGTGSSLAVSRDRRTLWVLSTTARRVTAVSPETLAPRRTITFPPDQEPRAVVVGPRTGRLYIAYVIEHSVQGRRDPPRDARIRVLNPAGTQRLSDTLVRAAGRYSWFVHTLAADDIEKNLYVSYHGSDTSGLDSLTISGSKLTRCQRAGRRVCWGQPHGHVQAKGTHVYTATGAPWLAEYTRNGTLSRRLETGLTGVHLMEFALSLDRSRLYAVASCGAKSGFANVDLTTGTAETSPSPACGNTIDATASSVLVGTTATGVPIPTRRGRLLALDPETGSIVGQHTTSAEAVDVLVAP